LQFSWTNLPAQVKIVLFIVFLLSCVLLFYIGLLRPQQTRIAELSNRVHSEQQKVQVVEKFALAYPNVDRHLAGLENKFIQTSRMLPDYPDIREFLLQVEAAANGSGVKLLQIQPGICVNKEGYWEVPIEIMTRGSFFQTITFLKKIEDCPRFNSVVRLSLQSQTWGLESNFVVVIYSSENAAAGKPLVQKEVIR